MISQRKSSTTHHYYRLAVLGMLAVVFILGCSKQQTSRLTETSQKTFATPAEAGQALQTAVRAKDDKAITQVLGPKARTLVSSGNSSVDATATDSFAKKYDRMNRWVAMTDGSQVLYVGADNYPFPIPLAQDGSSRWYFDATAGDDELRARRIGSNELTAMDAARLIAQAEERYHHATHQYTDTLISTPGQQDGLYWEVAEGQAPSPLGTLNEFAKGIFIAGAPSKTAVFSGYSFRILTAQGGFTIFASPVHYQHSGIMTFSLSRDGIIYQQDLGPQTADVAEAINQYKPTDGWAQAE
jgi:Protein of unknown function (DUF2950)